MTDQEQKRIFANNLSRLLIEHNKSQREVAEAIQVSPQTFNTWCQAIALPRMGKVQKLADYFHVLKSALLDEQSESADSNLLSSEEEVLLSDYRKLNKTGREKALDYVSDLAEQEKYTQDTESSSEQTA